jgi:prevent-host-death family protein
MKQMSAADFKARCLAVMDQVRATGEPVTVTKRGVPVVRVVPAPAAAADALGFMAGKFRITGDIVSPATPLSDWSIFRDAPPPRPMRRRASRRTPAK